VPRNARNAQWFPWVQAETKNVSAAQACHNGLCKQYFQIPKFHGQITAPADEEGREVGWVASGGPMSNGNFSDFQRPDAVIFRVANVENAAMDIDAVGAGQSTAKRISVRPVAALSRARDRIDPAVLQ